MKKYIISILTVCTFGVYALFTRMSGAPAVLPNNQLVANTTSNTSSNNSSGSENNLLTDILNSVSTPAKPTTTTKKTTTPKTVTTGPKPIPVPAPVKPQGKYRDGQYTGDSVFVYYGNVQVQAIVQNGALSNVVVLDYPQDRGTSVSINSRAMPELVREAVQAQSANVNTISGATDSSGGFRQSLDSALSQAAV